MPEKIKVNMPAGQMPFIKNSYGNLSREEEKKANFLRHLVLEFKTTPEKKESFPYPNQMLMEKGKIAFSNTPREQPNSRGGGGMCFNKQRNIFKY